MKTVLSTLLICVTCLGQEAAPKPAVAETSDCPIQIIKFSPTHESVLNNFATMQTVGGHTYSAHNKFLELKVTNISEKAVRGVKFAAAYYDSTEDLHTLPESWGWHGTIKPGETKSINWDNNLWQNKTVIGWVISPLKVLYEDGTKWESSNSQLGMFEWWRTKKHPRVNNAPDLDGVKNSEE